jgi:methylmalonyl-CoA mutase cobalamin-binding subunit
LRPLERTVEELLLPAIDELAADPEREAELEFGSRWATGWLHGARRLASAASRPAGILLLDSSPGQDAEEVHTQALDLALRRAGFRVLVLSNELGDERLERALGALEVTAIVLCGPGADTQDAVRLVRKIRELGFVAPLFGFRASGLIGAAVPSAGDSPSQVTGMLNADLRRRASQAFA